MTKLFTSDARHQELAVSRQPDLGFHTMSALSGLGVGLPPAWKMVSGLQPGSNLGRCRTPKSGLFELYPRNPPTKTKFLGHFVAKSGPFGRFGLVHCTLPSSVAMGLDVISLISLSCLDVSGNFSFGSDHLLFNIIVITTAPICHQIHDQNNMTSKD